MKSYYKRGTKKQNDLVSSIPTIAFPYGTRLISNKAWNGSDVGDSSEVDDFSSLGRS